MSSEPVPFTVADLTGPGTVGGGLLALNNAYAAELSWLEAERFRHLVAEAFMARRIGEAEAFLLAFDQDAAYDSANFLWFRVRYPRFVYVDRVVVDARARGQGHARRLYRALFAQARRAGHERVVCEVNASPPNPASRAFHADLGFVEVGTGLVGGGSKIVSYLLCELAPQ